MGIPVEEYRAMVARLDRIREQVEQIGPRTTADDDRERDLHSFVAAECQRRGWLALHGSMAHRTHRTVGEPDFVILLPGRKTLLVELKRRGEKPTQDQAALHEWARVLGHTVHVVRSLQEFMSVAAESLK